MALIEKFSALGTRSAPDFVANFCINSFSHLFTALYATAGGSIVSSGAPGRPYLKKVYTHKKLRSIAKGQLISKAIYGLLTSPKKMNERI